MPEPSKDYVEYAPGLDTRKSWEYFLKNRDLIPGGASSNFRAYPAFQPYPITIDSGKGSHVWDLDGNEYVDLICAFGSLIHGHTHPVIVDAVKHQLEKGSMHGFPHELEYKLASKMRAMVPAIEKVRFCNSGVEAVMHALRIARGYTGKEKIIMFEGGYHGALDYVLLSSSGTTVLGPRHSPIASPASWGIPAEAARTTIVLPWNDLPILQRTLRRRSGEIAAVLTEPVQMNYGCVLPEDGYLDGMRELCREEDVLLIFDEVKTGFRIAPGGAQEFYSIEADLVTYSKALGGGFPIAAIAGKSQIFEDVAFGKIDHAGTYNANAVCLAAAYASLSELSAKDNAGFKKLEKLGQALGESLQEAADEAGTKAVVQSLGGLVALYLTSAQKIREYRDLAFCDTGKYLRLHRQLISRGVFVYPGQYAMILSTAHNDQDVEKIRAAVYESLKKMTDAG